MFTLPSISLQVYYHIYFITSVLVHYTHLGYHAILCGKRIKLTVQCNLFPGELGEGIFLTVKNARAFRALRQVLHPGQCWLNSLMQLHCTSLAKPCKNSLGPPPDQILDPLLV